VLYTYTDVVEEVVVAANKRDEVFAIVLDDLLSIVVID
jgi:hypothetical protein